MKCAPWRERRAPLARSWLHRRAERPAARFLKLEIMFFQKLVRWSLSSPMPPRTSQRPAALPPWCAFHSEGPAKMERYCYHREPQVRKSSVVRGMRSSRWKAACRRSQKRSWLKRYFADGRYHDIPPPFFLFICSCRSAACAHARS